MGRMAHIDLTEAVRMVSDRPRYGATISLRNLLLINLVNLLILGLIILA